MLSSVFFRLQEYEDKADADRLRFDTERHLQPNTPYQVGPLMLCVVLCVCCQICFEKWLLIADILRGKWCRSCATAPRQICGQRRQSEINYVRTLLLIIRSFVLFSVLFENFLFLLTFVV